MTGLDARVVVTRPAFRLDVSLAIDPGEVVAVMGPSGAGKSTLLGVLAGLVALDEGHVRVAGRMLDSTSQPRVRTAPAARGVVLLGQEPRLFPHLSAAANIAFGLRVHGAGKGRAAAEAREWLDRVGLAGTGDRRPAQLSGGQQQRVALARALATSPAALLLDEPLTSLDTETAADVRALLHEQLTATRTTAIVATHDAVDAIALADRLVVVEDGSITQAGMVREMLSSPATRFVAAVAGLNRVVGTIVPTGPRPTAGVPRETAGRVDPSAAWHAGGLRLPLTGSAASVPAGSAVAAVFRPGDVRIVESPTVGPGAWQARVTRLEQTPAGVRVRTAEPDIAVDVAADRAAGLEPGAAIALRIDPADVRFVAA